jgi:hypothetical protein
MEDLLFEVIKSESIGNYTSYKLIILAVSV